MATRGRPNPHLYQSMALLAGEMGYVAEARRWFREGTRALRGRCSHALWHGWAVLEAQKVRLLWTQEQLQVVVQRAVRGGVQSPADTLANPQWSIMKWGGAVDHWPAGGFGITLSVDAGAHSGYSDVLLASLHCCIHTDYPLMPQQVHASLFDGSFPRT